MDRPALGPFLTGWPTVLSFRPHHGAVAQLVAHLVRNEGVRGSSPLSSTDRSAQHQVRAPFPIQEEGLSDVGETSSSKVQPLRTRVGAVKT